ncbi:MAG TPA: molybdate ABC transporter substrate-binding protein, partial [Burkholderiales bacterium]|nr:molybdate ABC transporter substrate-binding protein [Burkholderiales bacterium]
MTRRPLMRWVPVVLLGALLTATLARAQDLTVFAAASLKEALDDAASQFQRGNGQKVAVSYAGSPALAKQIENGAPADVFISADLDWMDYIAQRKLIKAGTRANLLRNRLVLIAPSGSRIRLEIRPAFALAAALGDGRLAMADPDSVPAGKYAKAALEKLGVWGGVSGKV